MWFEQEGCFMKNWYSVEKKIFGIKFILVQTKIISIYQKWLGLWKVWKLIRNFKQKSIKSFGKISIILAGPLYNGPDNGPSFEIGLKSWIVVRQEEKTSSFFFNFLFGR